MRLNSISVIFVLVIAIFANTAFSQEKAPVLSTKEQIVEDLGGGPCNNKDRFEAVKSLLKKNGVPEGEIRIDEFKSGKTLVVVKKGETDETVVIGAHYDKTDDGCGIIDNWSGVVILAHIIKTMAPTKTRKTYVFVAFDREEAGLVGSRYMVKAIPKASLPSYCSMVNLDSFGLGYPSVVENLSTSKMAKFAKNLGDELKVQVTPINARGASSDAVSFMDKKIPAITLSALNSNWRQYLHSPNDKLEHVLSDSVVLAYRFSLAFISRIENGTCNMFLGK